MPDQRRSSHSGLTLLATGLGLFMVFLDATIVNVALPSIQHDFDVGESGVQWVVAAYSLTMGMFMMTSASLADALGRRKVFIAGIAIFCSASLACGLAPNIAFLNAARAAQGIGAAVVNVASLALVGAAFPEPAAKARAVGIWTGIAGVGIAVGPSLGGVLTESLSWRWIFLINPIVGLIALGLTLAFVTESADPRDRGFDPLGQILFIIGIGAVTFALVQASTYGFGSVPVIASFAVSAVAMGLFARTELRSDDPMMDLRVFTDIPYTASIVTMFSALFSAYGTLLIITQYFQNVREYSPETTGLMLMSFAVPAMVMAPIAGRLAARSGGRKPTLVGLVLVILGCSTLAFGAGREVPITLTGLLLLGFGVGLCISPVTAVAMSSISPDRSGMASGILSVQRALGSTAGFAVMGTLLAVVVAAQLPGDLESVIPDAHERDQVVTDITDAANPQAVPSVIGPASSDPPSSDEVIAVADEAFVDGIRFAEAVGAVVTLIALLFAWKALPRSSAVEVTDELETAAMDKG